MMDVYNIFFVHITKFSLDMFGGIFSRALKNVFKKVLNCILMNFELIKFHNCI